MLVFFVVTCKKFAGGFGCCYFYSGFNGHFSSCVMQVCTCVEHVFTSVCMNTIDKSSAYEEIYALFSKSRMSCMYSFKSVELSTKPSEIPSRKFLAVDHTLGKCANAF